MTTKSVPTDRIEGSSTTDQEGDYIRLWCLDGQGQPVALIRTGSAGGKNLTPVELCMNKGWRPVIEDIDPQTHSAFLDWAVRTHERVWRYWITTPDAQLSGVRDFVAAAEAGGLPADWTETPIEDADGTAYTLCSFRLTMDGARSLGAEQSALMALADLPSGVFFFQTVASIEGFTGVEKESRQPTTLDPQLYEPGTLFQTSHPDAAAQRGSAFGDADVLDVTGLSLT